MLLQRKYLTSTDQFDVIDQILVTVFASSQSRENADGGCFLSDNGMNGGWVGLGEKEIVC